MAWHGEQHEREVEMAVSEITAAGGLLGETGEIVVADDYCDPQQAVAAANELIADDVEVVIGHNCSGAAIPASSAGSASTRRATSTATSPLVWYVWQNGDYAPVTGLS
jgi:branched-chain amino acid transport system substrate-binding protein